MQKLIACFAVLLSLVFSQSVFSESNPVMYAMNDAGPYKSVSGDVILGSKGNLIQMKATNMGTIVRDSDFNWSAPNKIMYTGTHAYAYGQSKSILYKIGKNEFLLKTVSEDDKVYTNEILTTSSLCHFYANEAELMKVINSWTSKDIMKIQFIID